MRAALTCQLIIKETKIKETKRIHSFIFFSFYTHRLHSCYAVKHVLTWGSALYKVGVAETCTKPPLRWDQSCFASDSLFSTLIGPNTKLLIKPPLMLQSTRSFVACSQIHFFLNSKSQLFKTFLTKNKNTYWMSCSLQWWPCSALHRFVKPSSPIWLRLMSNTHSREVSEVRTDARSSQLASVSLHITSLGKSKAKY